MSGEEERPSSDCRCGEGKKGALTPSLRKKGFAWQRAARQRPRSFKKTYTYAEEKRERNNNKGGGAHLCKIRRGNRATGTKAGAKELHLAGRKKKTSQIDERPRNVPALSFHREQIGTSRKRKKGSSSGKGRGKRGVRLQVPRAKRKKRRIYPCEKSSAR